jgi:hypothetical protein
MMMSELPRTALAKHSHIVDVPEVVAAGGQDPHQQLIVSANTIHCFVEELGIVPEAAASSSKLSVNGASHLSAPGIPGSTACCAFWHLCKQQW